MKKKSTLSRQMLVYFSFIAVAALLITIEFVWAVRIIMSQVPEARMSADEQGLTAILAALRTLQNKALLIGVVQTCVSLIVLVMLIRRITDPLEEMVEKSKRISEGDLSPTIRIYRRDEIGLMAETINGLTSNIQEIVALGLSTDAALRTTLQELKHFLPQNSVGLSHIDKIEQTLSGMSGFLSGFHLLPAPPTGKESSGG